MENRVEARNPRRRLLLGSGLAFAAGLGAAALTNSSAGCLIPDECILATSPGDDWCRYLSGAKMWPIGDPSAAALVKDSKGAPPLGCVCFNSAEAEILQYAAPAGQFDTLIAEIEQAARNQCDFLVPAGYDHDCYLTGTGAPVAETPFPDQKGACVGDCIYTDSCGDPNPYECECLVGQCDSGETGGGTDETGSGGLDGGSYIACAGTECDIDATFAEMLWDDPALLLAESTRLVYDSTSARFMFDTVGTGSVADELGFQNGDVLESVDSVVIDGLDTALTVFAASGDKTSLRVRILRGTQWVDLTFTFVN